MSVSPDTKVGYHGTPRVNVKSILEHGIWPSARELNWLGDGCYFYEDLTYTKYWCPNYLKTREIAFFQCDLLYGEVLELTFEKFAEIGNWKQAVESKAEVKSYLTSKGIVTMTDAMVFNNYCRFLQKEFGRVIDTIRWKAIKTIESEAPWAGSRFKVGREVSATQVCIRPHAAKENIIRVELLSD